MIPPKILARVWIGAHLALSRQAQAFTLSMAGLADGVQKPKLYDVPISNSGARCRFVIYEKGIEGEVDIVEPSEVGGLKSPEFLKMNPHGKMPTLNTPDCGNIPESETICHYLLETFEGKGASFRPSTKEDRMRAAAICRLFDVYVHPIQGCLYKYTPPFGVHSDRLTAIEDLENQLGILEDLASSGGPFLAGKEVSLADATVWPTMNFIRYMMPKFDKTDFVGQRVSAWCEHMEGHPVGKRIKEEISQALLEKFEAKGRWDNILHAGKRDKQPDTIFGKIVTKEIPSTVVFEDERVLAFRSIDSAPTYALIVPKRRDGLTQLRHATADHAGVLGHMLAVAAKIAREEKLEGYRLVINDGEKGGQEVFHLHMHLMGGVEGMEKLGKMW